MKYDLAIAYRIYPKIAKPSLGLPLSDDKLKLAEECLSSFRKSLGGLRVKIWALLDGCPEEYATLFRKYFDPDDLVLIPLVGIGNQATFAKQIDILLGQQESEWVYFAEDDYVYLPSEFPRMLQFFSYRQDADFVSPYDHPDCYQLELHHEPKWVTVFDDHHWRTAASTCLTFLTSKNVLARYERVFRTYARGNSDCSLWLSLTKRSLWNPLLLARFLVRREFYWKTILNAWRFCWRQILFGRTARLWVPIPGLATHYCANLLSPGTEWLTLVGKDESAVGRVCQ
jgi:hypothetical protein